MDFQEQIGARLSKKEVERIVEALCDDSKGLAELILLLKENGFRNIDRAAWVLGSFADKHIDKLIPHLSAIAQCLANKELTVAVKRNILRILRRVSLPENIHGIVMNTCFDFAASPNEPVAVRCFAMEVLTNLAVHYPEIKPEIKFIAEEALQQKPSAGLKNRAQQTLKMLAKLVS